MKMKRLRKHKRWHVHTRFVRVCILGLAHISFSWPNKLLVFIIILLFLLFILSLLIIDEGTWEMLNKSPKSQFCQYTPTPRTFCCSTLLLFEQSNKIVKYLIYPYIVYAWAREFWLFVRLAKLKTGKIVHKNWLLNTFSIIFPCIFPMPRCLVFS